MSLGELRRLPSKLVGDDGDRAVRLIADHAAAAVFAGKLAAFEIEGVAVAVAGGIAEDGDAAVFFDPAHLDVVGDVAPDQIAADAVPGRAFRPKRAGVEAVDDGVADDVAAEAIVERDDVGIGVSDRLLAGPIARRGFGRDGLLRLGSRDCRDKCCASEGGEETAAVMNGMGHTSYV